MKYSHDYTIQQRTNLDRDGVYPLSPNHKIKHNTILYDRDEEESNVEIRVKALEKRIESLEKQLELYEQVDNLKCIKAQSKQLTFSLSNYNDEYIKEVYRCITQLEEYYAKLSIGNTYPITQLDIEKVINDKFTQEQLKINLKISNLALKVKDLSQYNERQQLRFGTFQDSLILIDKFTSENSNQIKELYKQVNYMKEMFNDNSKEEELFLRNMSNSNSHSNSNRISNNTSNTKRDGGLY